MLSASVCTLMLVGALEVKAADDSYVDLSVLNNLQPGDSLFVETQPLFPIVKKDTVTAKKIKKAKKKTVKKTSPKAQKQEKVKTPNPETKKTEEKIAILPQAPVIEQPLAEKEAVEPQAEVKQVEVKPVEPQAKAEVKTAEPQAKATADVVEKTPAEREKNEAFLGNAQTPEQTTSSQMPEKSEGVITPPASASAIQSQAKEVLSENQDKDEKTQEKPAQAAPQSQPAQVSQALTTEEVSAGEAPKVQEKEKVIEPLIPQPAQKASVTIEKDEIRFAEGSYEISEENAQKILNLIATFENPQQNKIAIYAYNYDNGENSFKKKKLSLDRATEIRSLLLNKGYKNFSIKVINVTDSPDKSNLVEIEEIK